MTWRQIGAAYTAWIDRVAAAVTSVIRRFGSSTALRLVERDDGTFAVDGTGEQVGFAGGTVNCRRETAVKLNGGRVELTLKPSRFFFGPLEVPRRAADFLEGVVRAQIDRITPWTATESIFGWSAPVETAPDRIAVTVAAAPRAPITALVQALSELGARGVTVCTVLPDSARIDLLHAATGARAELGRPRRMLSAALLTLALLAAIAVTADIVVGGDLQRRQDEVSRRIAERRGLIRAGNDAIANSALAVLERRKNTSPASVIVLEALSKALPDNTYVTELRIEGDKMQVVGFTQDAPSLIPLIERSPHFARATFFAPTTRAPSDPGDRFHIEAQIKPIFSPPS